MIAGEAVQYPDEKSGSHPVKNFRQDAIREIAGQVYKYARHHSAGPHINS